MSALQKNMCTDRRDFLRNSAGLVGATLLGSRSSFAHTSDAETPQQRIDVPDVIKNLRRMTRDVVPITDDERKERIAKAQRLMGEQKIDAIYLEPGSSMFYFTGMRWGTSERMFALVIPQSGELAWVCPKFEEERARELIKFGKDVRTWEEDASPYRRVAEIFRDRGIRDGRFMQHRARSLIAFGATGGFGRHRAVSFVALGKLDRFAGSSGGDLRRHRVARHKARQGGKLRNRHEVPFDLRRAVAHYTERKAGIDRTAVPTSR